MNLTVAFWIAVAAFAASWVVQAYWWYRHKRPAIYVFNVPEGATLMLPQGQQIDELNVLGGTVCQEPSPCSCTRPGITSTIGADGSGMKCP